MSAIRQLNLPPTELKKVGASSPEAAAPPTPANFVGVSLDLAEAVLAAGGRLGWIDKQLADVFGLSAADFSSAFSPNRPDRNRLMKVKLPIDLARQIGIALCEATGVQVASQDAEKAALGKALAAIGEYIQVAGAGK